MSTGARDAGAMPVLFAAAEAHPLVKTGGLGDVAGFLPRALREQGLDVRLALPGYRAVLAALEGAAVVARPRIEGVDGRLRVLEGELPGTGVPLYVLDAPVYFDRPGNPYLDAHGRDWPDNAARFAAFARMLAAMGLGRAGLAWRPRLLHCNDWHTALAPALLAGRAARPATVFGIHTLAHQGLFPASTFTELALPEGLWGPEGLEFHGRLSFIKGGLAFADRLVTVSPTYARAITTAAEGFGLDGLLRHRAGVLTGILNGVDYRVWDPRADGHIARPYWIDDLTGKRADKRALQAELGLAADPGCTLVGHIGRFAEQKGTDLIIELLPALMEDPGVQVAVLGDGPAAFTGAFGALAERFAGRLAVRADHDEALAHRIEAGADVFVMPSRFEPCGLNQLYSLRYGAVPVVRATGGLIDSVVDANADTLADGTASGFMFEEISAAACLAALRRALALRRASPAAWEAIMRRGMTREFGWPQSAAAYARLYAGLLGED